MEMPDSVAERRREGQRVDRYLSEFGGTLTGLGHNVDTQYVSGELHLDRAAVVETCR
ncbi:MAG: hypothetical protein JWL72_1471 [Ilumatobacteraceae bacterium]|nr:hypothetical protein [Ilumatobacteraceae bacterium]MCU1388133.1 hypothetical protein [Ilumatobacteraceae bacterium]